MKKRWIPLMFLISFLAAARIQPCFAGTIRDRGIQQMVNRAVEQTKDKQLERATEGISQDAKESVALAQQAYQLLLQNSTQEASDKTADALAHISSQAVKSLKKKTVPVEVVVQTLSGIEDAGKAGERAQKSLAYMKKGRLQEARLLLLPMVDEIDVQHFRLPVGIYTKNLRAAKAALAQGDRKTALASLGAAVSQLSVKVNVIPIPLVKAKVLIRLAGTFAKADEGKSLRLLKEANSYLQLCDTLGYTVARDMTVAPQALFRTRDKIYAAGVRQLDSHIIKESRLLLSRIPAGKDPRHQAIRQQLIEIIQTLSHRNTDQP